MSERIVNDPSQHGWTEVNGKWVWEGGSITGHIEDGTIDGQITTWDVAKTEWTPDGAVVVKGENVGIGTDSPASRLELTHGNDPIYIYQTRGTTNPVQQTMGPTGADAASVGQVGTRSDHGFRIVTNNTERMSIDANGNVGIGANNAVTTGLSLKNNYNLSWQEGSGTSLCNAFRQSSTGSFVLAAGYKQSPTAGGFASSQGGEFSRTAVRLGASIEFFADPAVNVPEGTDFTPTSRMTIDADGRVDIAGSLYVNGSAVGGGGLPDGGYTYGWSITATDFIATSDERLKDDITPLPVGLIDDIKPVQWNWKDGSGKSAGVIAQQLQAIGLDDFVNEDADGNLGVNYNALVGVLLAEVISLKAEVESLK